MAASSITSRISGHADFRRWLWWQLPKVLRLYLAAVVLAAAGLTSYAASQTTWHVEDILKYLLLLGCALGSVAATPRSTYIKGGMTRDFVTVWVLPVAILLPPVYAMTMPVPLYVLTHWRVHRGVVHRRVFTTATITLAYGAASLAFRLFPASFAGANIRTGAHALTWAIAVVVCELFAGRSHNALLLAAIKLSDPTVRLAEVELNREALLANFAEFHLGVLITLVVAANPLLSVFAVPTIILARRFMMHAQLLAQARVDTKTGLLNSSTWETEAAEEVARAVRMRTPASLALIDIDHFKLVNDTHGHLVGDVALRAVTDAIREHLRSYDLAGRFGGEEFVVLLPNAGEAAAVNIAERLRTHIAGLAIPADPTGVNSVLIRLTISVGVATLDDERRELTDLMAAADAALYQAKQSGRNRTRVTPSKVPASQPAAEVQPTAPQHPSTASC
jgi:diguanylate cyclase (GGDEF)-like protein